MAPRLEAAIFDGTLADFLGFFPGIGVDSRAAIFYLARPWFREMIPWPARGDVASA